MPADFINPLAPHGRAVAIKSGDPLASRTVTAALSLDRLGTGERIDWHKATCWHCTPRYGTPYVCADTRNRETIRHLFKHPNHAVSLSDDDQPGVAAFSRDGKGSGFAIVCLACLEGEAGATPGRPLVWWRQHRSTFCGTRPVVA